MAGKETPESDFYDQSAGDSGIDPVRLHLLCHFFDMRCQVYQEFAEGMRDVVKQITKICETSRRLHPDNEELNNLFSKFRESDEKLLRRAELFANFKPDMNLPPGFKATDGPEIRHRQPRKGRRKKKIEKYRDAKDKEELVEQMKREMKEEKQRKAREQRVFNRCEEDQIDHGTKCNVQCTSAGRRKTPANPDEKPLIPKGTDEN